MELDEEAVIRRAMALVAKSDTTDESNGRAEKENVENGVGNENSEVDHLPESGIDEDNDKKDSSSNEGITGEKQDIDFETTPMEIVNSLRSENERLRKALEQEKSDLEQLTDQMTEILTMEEHDAKQAEQFLLATIKTGKKNHASLEALNKDLVDAISLRQTEILRLCEEGMRIESAYLQQIEKLRVMEVEKHDIRHALELQKGKEEEMHSKIQDLQAILEEKEEEILHLKSENSSRENLQSYMKDMAHTHEVERKDMRHSLEMKDVTITNLESSLEELKEKLKESTTLNKDMGSNLDECNEVIAGLEKERDEVRRELATSLAEKKLHAHDKYTAENKNLNNELEMAKQEIVRLNVSLSQSLEQETLRASQIIASKEEVSRLQAKLAETMHSLGLRENEVVNNVKQIVELKEIIEELKRNEIEYRQKERILEGQSGENRSASIEVERLTVLNTEARNKLLSYEVEIAELREANGNGSAEYNRVTALFDESQKLLIARDLSLEETQKNVGILRDEVKDLQIELGKSEHLRLHSESSHQGIKEEVSMLEIELQKAREGTLKANVSMNHAQAALDSMTGKYDELNAQFKELIDEKNELRVTLSHSQHEYDMINKEMNHLHLQLENVGKLYEKDEVEVKGLRYSLRESEEKLRGVESRETDMRVRYEKETKELRENIDFLSKNGTKLEKDLAQSEYQRLHHEGNSKSVQEELNTMELEVLQLREDVVKANMALSQSTTECDALKKTLEIAENRFATVEEERKNLNSSLLHAKEEQSKQNIDFIDKLNNANSRTATLTDALSVSNSDLGSKSSDLSAANREISSLQELLMQTRQTVETLQLDNEKLQESINSSLSPLEGLERINQEYSEREKLYISQQATLGEMETVQNGLETELREANTKAAILNREIANLTKVMEKKEHSIVKLRDANNKGSAEYGRISALYDESQKLVNAKDVSLVEANKSIEALKEQNQNLNLELSKVELSLQHKQEELSASSTKVITLEKELTEQRAMVVKATVEISHLQEIKNSLQTSNEDLKNQLAQNQEKLRGDIDGVNAAQSANDLLQENLKQLNCELHARQDSLDVYTQELNKWKEKNQWLESEIRIMTVELDRNRSECDDLKKSVEHLSMNDIKLEKDLAQSEYQRIHHKEHAETVEEKLHTLEVEMQQLREDLSRANVFESQSSTALHECHERIVALEAELKESRVALVNSRDEFALETSQQVLALRDDILKLSNDLTASREVLGIRVGELNASRADIENLKQQLKETQQDAHRLVAEKEAALIEAATLKASSSIESPLNIEMDGLKKEVARLEKFADSQSKTIEEMDLVERGLEEELKTAQQEIKDIRETNSKVTIEYTRLTAVNDENIRILASKEIALKEAHKAINDANEQIDSLEAELNELRLKSVEFVHIHAEMQRLQNSEKNVFALSEEVHALKTSKDILGKDLTHVQEQMIDASKRAQSCQHDLEREREINSSLVEEIKALRVEMSTLLDAKSVAENDFKDVVERSEQENKRLLGLLDQSRIDHEKMSSDYMDKFAAMQEDTYKLAVQLSEKSESSVSNVEEIKRYEALILQKDAAIERLTSEYQHVQSELRHCEELRSALEHGQRAITEELSALTTKVESLEMEIKDKDDLLKSQSNALDENEDVTVQLEKEAEAYKDQMEKIQNQLEAAKAENDHLLQELRSMDDIKQEIFDLRRSLKELESMNTYTKHDSNKKLTCIQNELLHIANTEIGNDSNSVGLKINLVNEYDRVKNICNKSASSLGINWKLGISATVNKSGGAEVDDGGMPSPEATNEYQPKVSSVVDKFESRSQLTSLSPLKSASKSNPFSF